MKEQNINFKATQRIGIIGAVALCVFTGVPVRAQSGGAGSQHQYRFLSDDHGPTQENAYVYYDYTTIPPGGGVAGPILPSSSFWHINQYNNPAPVQPTSGSSESCEQAPLWSLGTPTTGLCWIAEAGKSGVYDIVLAQTGQAAPPYQLACGTEYDLLFSPDNFHPVPAFQNSPTLAAMNDLKMGINFQLQYINVVLRCGASNPWLDQGTALAALVLSNITSGQTLFYQLLLSASNGSSSQFCTGAAFWFWAPEPGNSSVYGVNEYLGTAYGEPCATTNGAAKAYHLDLLPRLKDFIANSPDGALDTDYSHWTVSGAYWGNELLGGGTITDKWSNISLEATL